MQDFSRPFILINKMSLKSKRSGLIPKIHVTIRKYKSFIEDSYFNFKTQIFPILLTGEVYLLKVSSAVKSRKEVNYT